MPENPSGFGELCGSVKRTASFMFSSVGGELSISFSSIVTRLGMSCKKLLSMELVSEDKTYSKKLPTSISNCILVFDPSSSFIFRVSSMIIFSNSVKELSVLITFLEPLNS